MIRAYNPETDRDRIIELAAEFLTEAGYPESLTRSRFALTAEVDHVAGEAAKGEGVAVVLENYHGWTTVDGFFAALIYDHHLTGERTAFEIAWYVTPPARHGTGGFRLLQRAERESAQAGATSLQVSSLDGQLGSFLKRNGYTARETTYVRQLS